MLKKMITESQIRRWKLVQFERASKQKLRSVIPDVGCLQNRVPNLVLQICRPLLHIGARAIPQYRVDVLTNIGSASGRLSSRSK